MRKAVLLFNPDSGGHRVRRQQELESALVLLRGAGVEAELVLPRSRADALEHTRQAILAGCDTVFACGGDGTIHNIIQVLTNSACALAVLPMGTANALAHDLGLPIDPVAAANAALQGTPRRVALGHIQYLDFEGQPGARYFIVAAGAGVDAHLFYKLHTGQKQRLGMAAYYAKAWRLWLTHRMVRFQAEFRETGSSPSRQANITELMAVRIRNFGGILRELAPGASLARSDLRLVLCHTDSRSNYLMYVTRGLLGRRWAIPGIELVHSERASCQYAPSSSIETRAKVYVEADGELLGTLPAEITAVPNALTILAPSH
jgi:YegS/Rv2252/BmrU family lipid kinase